MPLPKEIKIADLRHPIALVRSSRTPNATTGFILTQTPYRDEFAIVKHGEKRFGRRQDAELDSFHVFTIRYDPTLLIKQRDSVIFEGEIYTIQKTKRVETKNRFEWLTLMCLLLTDVADSGWIPGIPGDVDDNTKHIIILYCDGSVLCNGDRNCGEDMQTVLDPFKMD